MTLLDAAQVLLPLSRYRGVSQLPSPRATNLRRSNEHWAYRRPGLTRYHWDRMLPTPCPSSAHRNLLA